MGSQDREWPFRSSPFFALFCLIIGPWMQDYLWQGWALTTRSPPAYQPAFSLKPRVYEPLLKGAQRVITSAKGQGCQTPCLGRCSIEAYYISNYQHPAVVGSCTGCPRCKCDEQQRHNTSANANNKAAPPQDDEHKTCKTTMLAVMAGMRFRGIL